MVPPFASAPADVYSCGREDAPSGTQGSFDLIDRNSGIQICTIDWNGPYAPGPGNENYVNARNLNSQYAVDIGGNFKKDKGTLQKVNITIKSASDE